MPPTPETRLLGSGSRSRDRSRGQVAVIFALSIVLFVSLCAVVVDVAFYWVSTLKVQRAADAAALAGAVYLPGDRTTAYAEARASATQNDYTGAGGVTVTPVQDSDDPRQLDVTITASSPAFFARVVGITSFPVTRSAKGVYVLPVPMGSPLAYYGVGDFSVNTTSTVVTPGLTGNSGARAATVTPSSVWTPSTGSLPAAVNTADTAYAYTTTNVQAQQVVDIWPADQPRRERGRHLRGRDQGDPHERPAGRRLQSCNHEHHLRRLVGRRRQHLDLGNAGDRQSDEDRTRPSRSVRRTAWRPGRVRPGTQPPFRMASSCSD